jgi:UPF0755 protein
MSDGDWYGYPQQPDPYSQPQDDPYQAAQNYGNAPQSSGYDQYGRPTQPSPQQQYYQQQPQPPQPPQPQPPQQPRPRPQQQPQQGQGPGGSGQYRQQRPPQRPRPQPQQGQGQGQAQNPYFQQQQQQGYGYDTGAGTYGGYPQAGYDTGGYPQQDYQRSGYDTSAGYPTQGYDSAASYDAASHNSGSYDTASSGSYDAGPSGSYDTASSGSYDTGSRSGGYPTRGRQQPQSPSRDPYSDLAELAEQPDEYEYPNRAGRRRAPGPGTSGEQPQVSADGRLGLMSDDEAPSENRSAGLDDGEDGEGRRRGGRSGRRGGADGKQKDGDKKKPRRSCVVIFLFFALIAGGLGYGAIQGYDWYKAHYGAPADYSSTTGVSATAIVTVPSSASGTQIAAILYSAGVVESERAFIQACNNNAQCPNIQANTYQLHKQMSAAAAVTALLNTGNIYNKSQLLVKPGERASEVFADLEQKTGWTQAQIVAAIDGGKIDLPGYATAKAGTKYPFANIEGMLFTGTYQLPSFKTPTALLKAMVDQQVAMFNAVGLTQKASSVGMTPYQVLIVASMARAEAGSNAADLAKISGVIYTRLKSTSFSKLGFDTATLYGLGRTEPQPTAAELADTTNPYNLRVVRGLPPGPIDSVDQTALMGALSPTNTGDVYFCAVSGTIYYAANDTDWAALGRKYPGYCG